MLCEILSEEAHTLHVDHFYLKLEKVSRHRNVKALVILKLVLHYTLCANAPRLEAQPNIDGIEEWKIDDLVYKDVELAP